MSTKLVKAVGISVAVLLACALVYGFVINRPDAPDADLAGERGRSSRQPVSHDLLFDGVAVEGREDGERAWMLRAARVETGAGVDRAEMYQITEGEIYRGGEPYLTFSAGQGIYDRKTGQLRLDGGVKVASGGKDLLATDGVVWDPRQSKVLIPGKTEIATSAGVVTVDRLEVDIESDKMLTAGDVLVSEAEGKNSFRIEGDNICFSSDGESFEARGETTIHFELDDSED